MRKVNRFLLLATLVCLVLGQLTRITVTPQVAFYLHDALCLAAVVLNGPTLWRLIRETWQKKKVRNWVIFVIGFAVFGWIINQIISVIPLLYVARLVVYTASIAVYYNTHCFSPAEWRMILTFYFAALVVLGLGQYLLWPDTRLLEYLGWDDHYYRVIGTWFDPAFTGLSYVMGLVFWWQNRRFFWKSRLFKNMWWTLVLGTLVALILTYSRAAYLALAGVGFIELIRLNSQAKQRLFWRARRKMLRVMVVITAVAGLTLGFLARTFPSDSTNLLRTNSIRIRLEMAGAQFRDFAWWQWLTGRGVFVPLRGETVEPRAEGYKVTAAFPDNFELLLVSFCGVPVAVMILWAAGKYLKRQWRVNPAWCEVLVCIIIHSQFNQSVFQPFVWLTAGFLYLFFSCLASEKTILC